MQNAENILLDRMIVKEKIINHKISSNKMNKIMVVVVVKKTKICKIKMQMKKIFLTKNNKEKYISHQKKK